MQVLLVGVFALVVNILFPPHPPKTEEFVMVMPSPDGHIGGVVVQRGGKTIVLDRPYASTHSIGWTEVETPPPSPQEVQKAFASVLTALPPRAATFLLYFVSGTDELTEESKAYMKQVLEDLRSRPLSDIVVIGHTDRVGSRYANDQLSLQRAKKIKAAIVAQGISPERVRADGRGEREPLVPTADGVAEPRNRRVEIDVR